MHASAICSILQPTEQTRASTAPLVKQLCREVFRKKPPARVWADIWDVKKVLDLLHGWGKCLVLNYTHLTLKTVMILVLAKVKRQSELNLLRITPGAMQISEDSDTFQPVFWAKNGRPNHPYDPIITLRWVQDECLCAMRLIKEYIARTKDREDQRNKLFVTTKMGPAVAVSIGTIASWLKETLTLANIRASGESTRKAVATYVTSQGAFIKTTMEVGDWAHPSMMYGHCIRCFPKEVLVRILEQMSASIKGLNVAKTAIDNPCWEEASVYITMYLYMVDIWCLPVKYPIGDENKYQRKLPFEAHAALLTTFLQILFVIKFWIHCLVLTKQEPLNICMFHYASTSLSCAGIQWWKSVLFLCWAGINLGGDIQWGGGHPTPYPTHPFPSSLWRVLYPCLLFVFLFLEGKV